MNYSWIKVDGLARYQGRLCFIRQVNRKREAVVLVWDENTLLSANFDELEVK